MGVSTKLLRDSETLVDYVVGIDRGADYQMAKANGTVLLKSPVREQSCQCFFVINSTGIFEREIKLNAAENESLQSIINKTPENFKKIKCLITQTTKT